MFLPHFDVFFDLLLNRRMAPWNLLALYSKETNYHVEKAFLFQNLSTWLERALAFALHSAHFDKHEKKPFDVIYCLYK